ncbi:MAG: glycine--tRNA ligase subunit beta [Kordiimonadaceae bacterium]|nr:glycine--tRNA ligase subunit beta [Kordiimonadaceae bacterium]
MADLLIELFSEEIPARMQKKASGDLQNMITKALKDAGLTFDAAAAFATPRRLALSVTGIPAATPDISEERRGPSTSAPEKALEGFMRGAGVTRDQLEEREEKKGTFFYAIIEKPGRPATDVISEALEATVRNFPWPKSQRWGDTSLKWVRPLHSILCIFGGETVAATVDSFTAGNTTNGHRFMGADEFAVTDFADYKAKLADHKVMLDPADRMALIEADCIKLSAAKGVEWIEDRGLLAEVAGLVEWPVPLMGGFDDAFMAVPEEVLILTMKKDQKYFVTRDPKTGKLAPYFITVSNIEASDDGVIVAAGNERVLTARLADAKFFWEQDLKGKLEDNLPKLADIVFHKELGMVSDRGERMKKLARHLAQFIPGCDADEAERAAELAKADLVSNMVNEFASLQGTMGRYYAKAQGASDAVADAIRDHYAPAGPSDECPSAPVSVAVALAEKLDTLVGFFGINQKPTGSKDPFALRRSALGVIRLVTENGLRLNLVSIFDFAGAAYLITFAESINPRELPKVVPADGTVELDEDGETVNVQMKISDNPKYREGNTFAEAGLKVKSDLVTFFGDRLKVQQRDKGVRHDLIDAVFSQGDDDLVRILNRVAALSGFLDTDDGVNLLAGYKRAANILKIEEKKDGPHGGAVDAALLALAEEKTLADALGTAKAGATAALEAEEFEKAMGALSTLRAPIDAFFDGVKVNDDDAAIRKNRLALLSEIRAAVNTVADFGLIEG